ncbi:NAD-dependent protein deacetylase [Quadrisphaera oryzae]|uniref:NAD-dependent protein deacetylase n=1 Tax=Quadrisphaera TaxID=317661 RepID=UPI00351C9746
MSELPASSVAGSVEESVEELAALLSSARASGRGVMALTGAGMSTASGIPDYRGPTGSQRKGSPMRYEEFLHDPEGRRRYWARSYVGWWQIATARPNAAHAAVADLQRSGAVGAVVTQNVDGLHQAAGSERVLELHGTLARVVCLGCGAVVPRAQLDRRLRAANPGFAEAAEGVADQLRVNPDGDVDLPEDLVASFVVVLCPVCEVGTLKPDVVYFGEPVPKDRVERAYDLLELAPALLVLGSSLTVMSGYRFVRAAVRRGQPVAVVTDGATRADADGVLKVAAPVQELLPQLVSRLASEPADALSASR